MEDSELIARQAKKLEELRDEVALLRRALREVAGHIYCIGGPLNDNKLGFTKEQRVTFHKIAEAIRVA